MRKTWKWATRIAIVAALAAPSTASAADVAVFGDNAIDEALVAAGHSVSLVSDAQLATPGFVDGFDAFVYTRNGISLGQSLSQAAAENVKAYVRRTVLLNGDFADSVPADGEVTELVVNSVAWAAATGHGYVGEFNGAFAGLTSNGNSLRALDLISGSASAFTTSGIGTIAATPAGANHPVLDGVALPRDPVNEDLGAIVSGVAASKVLARYTANDNPAVIASDLDATRIAVLGDNAIDDALIATGLYEVELVTDAQLATPGFLDGFDAFVYTRNGISLGQSLSERAAASVKAYVDRAVLLNGDFADSLPADAEISQLVANSVAWAAATGHGYVGEFNGAFAGLTSNGNSFRALNLISGSASAFTTTGIGTIAATAAGVGHPVLDGVALPRDPANEDLGAIVTGVDATKVLARYTANDNPAVIAADVPADTRRMVTNATIAGTKYASIVECNAAAANARTRPFTVQWTAGATSTFKVTNYRRVACLNDAAVPGAPNGFDTQYGEAAGTLDGAPGYRIEWTMVDGGVFAQDRVTAASVIRESDGAVMRTFSGAPTAGTGHFAMAPG